MPQTLPTIRSGRQALYPVIRRNEFSTTITKFQDATEQRWLNRPPLYRFDLVYTGISKTDALALETFFNSVKGQFDSILDTDFEFTLGATLYQNLALLEDVFPIRETRQGRYDCGFRFRQTKKQGQITPSGSGSFPALASGVTTQIPYERHRRFKTTMVDQDSGPRYAWAWYGAALSGFPTTSLRAWMVGGPAVEDADANTLEAFFAFHGGRYGTFSFTDPDTTIVHSKVRFGEDIFERRFVGPNQNALAIRLEEFN